MSLPIDSKTPFTQVFDAFIHSYIDHSTNDNMGLITYFDKQWLSPCLQSFNIEAADDGDEVPWKPSLRDQQASLVNLEEALDLRIPSELQALFCRYYSHDLNASAANGKLTILQVWNEEDFDRLQKNLISHVLMKRRLKQAETLFFALTDEEDFILSVMLSTGAVVLEQVGKEPQREIAPSLSAFMAQISPAPELVTL
ncbi:protein syd [Glaciecola punicea ACAM 611]|jgi:SecY interacting protein Syd|uniref:Protein syd n=1 Tax=Glaciecola punicea ACAM 611 TaxID=1121923 RepID=H5TB54_9ALTE|nr:SecY-interacting protein [Glaciecola punicea]GAB55531.1 protein syd [Glaciecola punicea ACAM 611]